MKQKILFILLTLALGSCAVLSKHASFYAKEYCSCLFVEENKASYCHSFATQFIEPTKITLSESKQTIEASTFGQTATAQYSLKSGCILR